MAEPLIGQCARCGETGAQCACDRACCVCQVCRTPCLKSGCACSFEREIPSDLGIALSVHAPWAWAIMFGGKDVENRSPKFPRNRGGKPILGRVWIHASLWPGPGALRYGSARCDRFIEAIHAATGRPWPPIVTVSTVERLRGKIVGSVEVYGYATPDSPPDSVWYIPGSLGILVRDPRPLVTPVRAKGALGWWGVPDDVLAECRRAA